MQGVEPREELSGERSNTPGGKEKRLEPVQHKLWAAEHEVRWSRFGMKQQGDCRK